MAQTKQDRARAPVYIGFSTHQTLRPPYTLTDIELVKQDLLNTFRTPMGERVMRPTYGSNIQRMLFDPFDDITKQEIIDDAVNVINSEPRVRLNSVNVREMNYGLKLEIVLYFVPRTTAETLYIDFINESEDSL